MREIAYLPLAEDIPVAFDSCRKGPRGIEWRDDKPAEVGGGRAGGQGVRVGWRPILVPAASGGARRRPRPPALCPATPARWRGSSARTAATLLWRCLHGTLSTCWVRWEQGAFV